MNSLIINNFNRKDGSVAEADSLTMPKMRLGIFFKVAHDSIWSERELVFKIELAHVFKLYVSIHVHALKPFCFSVKTF